jgi:hypothetical protein
VYRERGRERGGGVELWGEINAGREVRGRRCAVWYVGVRTTSPSKTAWTRLCNLAGGIRAPWGWCVNVETCRRDKQRNSIINCQLSVHSFVRCTYDCSLCSSRFFFSCTVMVMMIKKINFN